MKTRFGGYDGKGQILVRDDSELDEAYQLVEKQECVAEQYLDIKKEVSLTVTIEMNNKQHTFLFKKMSIKIKYYLKQSFRQELIKNMKHVRKLRKSLAQYILLEPLQ